jgi:REP element-mobilizing transposase RayT
MAEPLALFITFNCYGAWLHGDPRGSVNQRSVQYNTPILPAHRVLHAAMKDLMIQPPVMLNAAERAVVLDSIVETCRCLSWNLLAAHVRTSHVHAVIAGDCVPEGILRRLKAYATRDLNRSFGSRRRRWANHGSTRYLWNEVSVAAAVRYVVEGQGAAMAVYMATPDREPGALARG